MSQGQLPGKEAVDKNKALQTSQLHSMVDYQEVLHTEQEDLWIPVIIQHPLKREAGITAMQSTRAGWGEFKC